MPVVSTYHAGIPEIVDHGASGLLVPERDSEALALALRELLANPSTWETYGQRGRALIEDRHSLSAVGERLEAVYWGTETR
jgi:colanic acid/amylovoran biosynthesis glycosyltransferase